MTEKHLAKPIGTTSTTTINACLTGAVIKVEEGRQEMSPYVCAERVRCEAEGGFQIEVNFIIQSNKYQKRIKHQK